MQEIDSYVELVDLEITSNLNAVPRIAPSPSLVPTAQLAMDVPAQPAADIVPSQLENLVA